MTGQTETTCCPPLACLEIYCPGSAIVSDLPISSAFFSFFLGLHWCSIVSTTPLDAGIHASTLTTFIPSVAQEVQFQRPQLFVGEKDDVATVVIVMNGKSRVNITLNVRTIPGTARGMISISVLLKT